MRSVIGERKINPDMSLIEGIGDEVIQFFGFVFIVILVITAWSSTRVREATSCRCIILVVQWLQRRVEERSTSSRTINGSSVEPQQSYVELIHGLPRTENVTNEDRHSNAGGGITETHENSQGGVGLQPNQANDQTQLSTARVSPQINEHRVSYRLRNGASGVINIKLKYLDDTVKIAEGSLFEKLGEFRKRHFNSELSQRKTVNMIFNGRILQDDEQTLEACGLFDHCAVHCLIRQPPQATQRRPPAPNRSRRELFMIVFPSWGTVLVGMWYLRYNYAQLFSISATTGMLVLSCLYIASLVGAYLPEERINLMQI